MHSPCKYPFYGLGISSQGHLTPCCAFTGSLGEVNEVTSITDLWKNGATWQSLRQNEIRGQWTLPGCSDCKKTEHLGHNLKKQADDIFPKTESLSTVEPRITHLDIAFSNTCNLTCAMCSSRFSSSWVKPDMEFASRHNWRSTHKAWSLSYEQIDQLLPHLGDFESIEVKGGEPLFDKKARYFLKKVSESPRPIPIVIFSNFTTVDEEMGEILANLPALHLNLSIDGTGKTYEWIRGHSFASLEQNIFKFLPKLSQKVCGFGFVSSVYNMHNILEYWQWIESLMNQLDVLIIPSFSLIALNPEYLNPQLSKDIPKALADIEEVKAHVSRWPDYSASELGLITGELDSLKKLLLSPFKASTELLTQQNIWHENMVKLRRWDILSPC